MSDINTFVRRINRRGSNLERNVEAVRKDTAAEMLRTVVYATPADKGVARSNWQVGSGIVPTDFLPAYFPSFDLGMGETANAEAAIAAGLAAITASKPDQILYLTNNAPYIRRLNSGYSRQAPAGFIELAFERGRRRVQRARRLLE